LPDQGIQSLLEDWVRTEHYRERLALTISQSPVIIAGPKGEQMEKTGKKVTGMGSEDDGYII
jgi:hypothetical protein